MSSAVPGATEVRKEHQFDPEALLRYLVQAVPELFAGRTWSAVLQFKGGQSNPTFYLKTSSGEEYCLRKKPPGKLLPTAHAVDREYNVIKALSGTNVPVPKPIVFCHDESVIGTPFYIMEYIRGRIFRDTKLPDLSPEDRRAVYTEMATILAKLHNIDYKSIGLTDFGNPKNYYERQIARWSKQYDAAKVKPLDPMEKLKKWLPANIPDSKDGPSIVHGDFRIDNLVFHATEPRVLAVLDWELSTIGHPLADLAYSCLHYQMPILPPPMATMSGFGKTTNLREIGIPTQAEYIAAYREARVGAPPVTDISFYTAFGLFRLSSILVGVYRRGIDGNASSENAKRMGSFAELLAARALQIGTSGPQCAPLWMDLFPFSPNVKELYRRLSDFMSAHVYPAEAVLEAHDRSEGRWAVHPIIEELKSKARAAHLWNLFLELPNLDYAPLCELMGRSLIAPEIFNCNAPDTGNMEVLERYGSPEQRAAWLEPLLRGEIRSAFAMTEPGIASSDATNISTSIKLDDSGEFYVINGRKWWTTGAAHPNCKILIVMGKTDPSNKQIHKQQSMILVPRDTPGVRIVRALQTFGFDDAPYGHVELEFQNVHVPASNIILGEGRGFEIAQGRLGPGRIHHCMRLIGLAERALEAAVARVHTRRTFGKKLAEHGVIMKNMALSRTEIDQARLLTLQAAFAMDAVGNQVARDQIAAIKIVAPRMACNVIDRAMQAFGAAGLSEDYFLARAYAGARSLRLADGPDEVHEQTLAKIEYSRQLRQSKL